MVPTHKMTKMSRAGSGRHVMYSMSAFDHATAQLLNPTGLLVLLKTRTHSEQVRPTETEGTLAMRSCNKQASTGVRRVHPMPKY